MKYLIITAIFFTVSACNFVDDFNKILEDQRKVQNIVKERYDLDSQFGLNVNNGNLMQVTMTLSAVDVRDNNIAELEAIVAEVVPEVFDQAPQQVLIIVHN